MCGFIALVIALRNVFLVYIFMMLSYGLLTPLRLHESKLCKPHHTAPDSDVNSHQVFFLSISTLLFLTVYHLRGQISRVKNLSFLMMASALTNNPELSCGVMLNMVDRLVINTKRDCGTSTECLFGSLVYH